MEGIYEEACYSRAVSKEQNWKDGLEKVILLGKCSS